MIDEQQQDASSALTELDKGLRAQKVGQQCEAIVRFPGLFERFPFPILINSAFLKLADVFRDGNNFLRLCILRVAQQSSHHLDKILNVAEFRKRISVVIHSNDPYARAITLRMFGSIAIIISDEKSVHHSIRQGLDSHDRAEQEAAVYAAIQFSSCSEEFAKSICNIIAAMLQGLSTPLEVKLKLIPILQNMYYDVQVSSKSRDVLQELLPVYPAEEFVVATLNTLTSLSLYSLVDIPAQIALLLQHLRCDPRQAVKVVTLQNLNSLADVAPHLWSMDDVSGLCKTYSLTALHISLKGAILDVFCTLMNGNSVLQLIHDGNKMIDICRRCYCERDLRLAALATKLLVLIVTQIVQINQSLATAEMELLEECAQAMESLIAVLTPESAHSLKDWSTLKILLPAMHKLCLVATPDIIKNLFRVILDLVVIECQPNNDAMSMLLEILASVAMKRMEDLLSPFSLDLFKLLSATVANKESAEVPMFQRVVTHICTLIFISNRCNNEQDLGNRVAKLLTSEESSAHKWTWYRVARQASRIGEHRVASGLFQQLSLGVVSERYYYWLRALCQFELAETILQLKGKGDATGKSHIDQKDLFTASQRYQEGLASLNAAVSPEHQLCFQLKFAKLRCSMLVAYSHLLMVCQQLRITPALGTLESELNTTNGDCKSSDASVAYQYGPLKQQLKECGGNFLTLASKYRQLHLTSFDADPISLANIDILQQSCMVMAHAVEMITNFRGQETVTLSQVSLFNQDLSVEDRTPFTMALSKAINDVSSELVETFRSSYLHLNDDHIECVLNSSAVLLAVPLSFPRYFYQSLQTTTIKLAISPSQRSPNEPVIVDISENLALKIEGVIRHGGASSAVTERECLHGSRASFPIGLGNGKKSRLKTFRRVKEVTLSVKSTCTSLAKLPSNHAIKGVESDVKYLEQTVKPHNDYFHAQFLLSIPIIGTHNLVIECSLNDERGILWKCGPTETLTVRCSDDSTRVKNAILSSQQASTR